MEHLRLRPKTYHFCELTTIYCEHRYKASIAGDKVFVGNPCHLARRNGRARLRRRQLLRPLVRRRDPPRVLAVVKRLAPSDAEARKAGAELETIEGGFSSMDELKAAHYLDGLAEKLSLVSSGNKANVLLAPTPWPRSPSEEQVFSV